MSKETQQNLTGLQKSFSDGNVTPAENLDLTLASIEKSETNAFVGTYESSREIAEKLGDDNAKKLPLFGVPIALKDNILLKGEKAAASSKMLENYQAVHSATVVEKLLAAGAIPVGRANMDEFAMGSSTESSFFGPTKNPFDHNRSPGGSSGGSAVAVAEGLVPVALGTDTGGSVRQPAAFCGVLGFKPTYGAVSRYGVISLANSLDQVGIFSNTVEDAELLFGVIKGSDPLDSNSQDLPEDNTAPKVIGVPRKLIEIAGVEPDTLENFNSSLEKLKEAGFVVEEIDLPFVEYSLDVYRIIMSAETSSSLARFDGVRYGHRAEAKDLESLYAKSRGEGFGEEVKKRILFGAYMLSADNFEPYFKKAISLRQSITKSFEEVFSKVDIVATPTTTGPAFKLGENQESDQMYLSDIFTVPANLAGLPAISIPSGEVEREGVMLPLGLQFMAAKGKDSSLFSISKKFAQIK